MSHVSRVHSSFPLAFIAPTRLAPTHASNDLSHAKVAAVSASLPSPGSDPSVALVLVRLAQLTIHMLLLNPLREIYRLSRCSSVRSDSASRSGKPGSMLPPPITRIFEMKTFRRSMASYTTRQLVSYVSHVSICTVLETLLTFSRQSSMSSGIDGSSTSPVESKKISVQACRSQPGMLSVPLASLKVRVVASNVVPWSSLSFTYFRFRRECRYEE